MHEATSKAAPKKKAHESMYDLVKSMRFPGRMLDGERRELGELLAMNCIVRKDDIIPEEVVESLCRDLLQVAVTTGNVISDEIWSFVVSQMDGEELAIMLLEEIANDVEEGWVIAEHPNGKHMAMATEVYNAMIAPELELRGMLAELGRMIPGLGRELPDIGGQIIARVGPQPEEEDTAHDGCVCEGCAARGVICPGMDECDPDIPGAGTPDDEEMPDMMDSAEGLIATGEPESADEVIQGIRDRCRQCADTTDAPAEQDSGQPETPAEDEESPVAKTGDTPAEESEEAVEVPAASD